MIHYLSYTSMEIEGKAVRDYVSFGTYLDVLLRHSAMEFRFRAARIGSTGELGGWGYAHAALQILGFAVGGAAVYLWLAAEPYCSKCSRYLAGKGSQARFSPDPEGFGAMVRGFAGLVQQGKTQEAIDHNATFGNRKYEKGHALKSVVKVKYCKKCGVHWLGFSAHKFDGRD